MTRKVTKEAIMLDLLRRGPVTSFDAVMRVPTTQAQCYVYHLRQKGFDIRTEMLEPDDGGSSYARWHLISEPSYAEGYEPRQLGLDL